MKRILILSALAVMAFAACKKKVTQLSTVVTASYPKVTITSPRFFSIPVGGTLPDANAIVATAYDSFYAETVPVVIDASNVSSLTPGLYTITVSGRSRYGYVGYENIYIAVTNVADTTDISGRYLRGGDAMAPAFVTKVARGLYHTTNLGGVDTTGQPASLVPGYFVMVDNTTIDLGKQTIPGSNFVPANRITGTFGSLDRVSVPNTYSYAFSDLMSMYTTGVKIFVKQ